MIDPKELDLKGRQSLRFAKSRYRLYKIKNREGNKTRGLSRNNTMVLFEFLNKHPVKDAIVIFCLCHKIENENELLKQHVKSFREDKPGNITVWIDKRTKWGRVVFGEGIKTRITEVDSNRIQSSFIQMVERNLILQASENLMIELHAKLSH